MSCVSWTVRCPTRGQARNRSGSSIGLRGFRTRRRAGTPPPCLPSLLWSGAAPPQQREPPSGPGTSPARGHPDDDHLHETHAVRSAEGSQCVRQKQWGRKQGFASRPPRHLNSGANTSAISKWWPQRDRSPVANSPWTWQPGSRWPRSRPPPGAAGRTPSAPAFTFERPTFPSSSPFALARHGRGV